MCNCSSHHYLENLTQHKLEKEFFLYIWCAAKAIFYCPTMNSHRPRSQNTSKEQALIPEKESKRTWPRCHVSLEKSSKNHKPRYWVFLFKVPNYNRTPRFFLNAEKSCLQFKEPGPFLIDLKQINDCMVMMGGLGPLSTPFFWLFKLIFSSLCSGQV